MFIGLTGLIGCGKSTVASILSQNSNFVIHNANSIAKEVINTDDGKNFICKNFGNEYIKDNNINYEKLRDVFIDDDKLKILTDYSHPLTEKTIKNSHIDNKINVVESPILFETEWGQWCSDLTYSPR